MLLNLFQADFKYLKLYVALHYFEEHIDYILM